MAKFSTSCSGLEPAIRVVEPRGPVFTVHRVFARADEITEAAGEQLAHLRHRGRAESIAGHEAIDRIRRAQHLELSRRIRPQVLSRVREQHGPRRAERDERVLIERQFLRRFVERLEVPTKPVREVFVDHRNRLRRRTIFVVELRQFRRNPRRRRTAATRLAGNDQRDAFIESRRKQRRLAIARVTDDRNPFGIQRGVGDEIIDRAMKAPRPHRDGRRVARPALRRAIRRVLHFDLARRTVVILRGDRETTELPQHALRRLLVIRHYVAVPKTRHRVTPVDRRFDRPFLRLRTARLFDRFPLL